MKVIIFDFDGTIADSFKLIIDITHKLTGHEALARPEKLSDLRRDSMVEVAKQLNIPRHMWPFLIVRGRRQMSHRLGEVRPFEGIDEVLSSLHTIGYRMFVMSTNSSSNIATFLTTNGLGGYFENIYGGVGLLNKAVALKKILAKNRLSPEEVVYVGDEVRDIEAAKSVNVPVVAVSWGFNNADRLAGESPTMVVHSRAQLLKALRSWEND